MVYRRLTVSWVTRLGKNAKQNIFVNEWRLQASLYFFLVGVFITVIVMLGVFAECLLLID